MGLFRISFMVFLPIPRLGLLDVHDGQGPHLLAIVADHRIGEDLPLFVINPGQEKDPFPPDPIEGLLVRHRVLLFVEEGAPFFEKSVSSYFLEVEKDDAGIAVMGIEKLAIDRIESHRPVARAKIEMIKGADILEGDRIGIQI